MKQRETEARRELHVLNLGAGVQSTALALMSLRGDIPGVPVFDAAIFADTQEEPASVYRHLDWLAGRMAGKIPLLIGSKGKLGNDLVHGINSTGQRFVSVPAFTTAREGDAGSAGMTRRQCTKDYKVDVIRQVLRGFVGVERRERMPKGLVVHVYLGLSFDEPQRIFGRGGRPGAKARIESDGWAVAHFPLYEMFLTRETLVAWLRTEGIPHETPRSACCFCPYHDDVEWARMKTQDSQAWARAVEVDRAIREHDSGRARGHGRRLYLHRSCVPLEEVVFKKPDGRPRQERINFSELECEGMCGA